MMYHIHVIPELLLEAQRIWPHPIASKDLEAPAYDLKTIKPTLDEVKGGIVKKYQWIAGVSVCLINTEA
jgi:hypothetical protein